VRDDTLHVLQEAGIATLLVTHDSEEAMFMGDRIALMRQGRILQVGVPEALYLAPSDRYVAGFLGEVNSLPARIAAGAPLQAADPATFYTPGPVGYIDYPTLAELQAG
jgi:iron(III) transport system ATP-binding protein